MGRVGRVGVVVAILGVLSIAVAARQSLPPREGWSDADAICAQKQAPHQSKRISGKGWRVRIGLDPCVSVAEAKKVLNALHEGRLVDRQRPFTPGITAGPRTIPALRMAQVLSIELTVEHVREGVPEGRLTVTTRDVSQSPSGLTLLVDVRGDDVDLYLISDWIE